MKRAIVAILIAALVGLLAWQIVVRVGDSAEGIVKKVGGPGGGATPVAVVDIARATVRDLQLFTGTLVRGDLAALVAAARLSRRTLGIIRQNLGWAFGYNLVAVPVAVLGLLHPVIAEVAMALSSITVVGNSLRLQRMNLRK